MFKTMTGVLDKNSRPLDTDIQKIPEFLFAKYLSNNPATISIASLLNQYHKIPIVTQYKAVKDQIAGKIKFIKYPKADSKDTSIIIKCLQKKYCINSETAKEYLELLSSEEQKEIENKYKDYL